MRILVGRAKLQQRSLLVAILRSSTNGGPELPNSLEMLWVLNHQHEVVCPCGVDQATCAVNQVETGSRAGRSGG